MKRFSKILVLMLAVCLVVSVLTLTQVEGKKLKIGVIYLTAEHPYYQAHAKHTQAYAKQKGFDLIELDGKVDQALMTSQMENLIAQKVDGIVYCLWEGKAASADINAAQKAGIPVVTFAIPHDRATANCPFVGIDEVSAGAIGGEAAGKYFKKVFPGKKAKIVVVEGTGLKASTDRSDGFIKGFTKVVPDAQLVKRLNGEVKKDKAMAVTEDLLQTNPDANVFYGSNGDQGLGALAALEANGRGTIKTELVVSHDGSEPEVLKIADPNSALKCAVANQPRELAKGTIDTLFEIIKKKRKMTNTDNIMIPAAVLSADDLKFAQKFIADEYFSKTSIIK